MAKIPGDAGRVKAAKKECPVSLAQFLEEAENIILTFEHKGQKVTLVASPKEFSSKSFGWGCNEKTTIMLGKEAVKIQAGINMTVVNSSEAPRV